MNFEKIPTVEHGPHVADVKEEFREYVPDEFVRDPMGYFEHKGVNIKKGDIERDDAGRVREDPTAVKDFPEWENAVGKTISVVAKRVNMEKGEIRKTADPFYEYAILELLKKLDLPAPRPIAKSEQGGLHLVVMEKAPGHRLVGEDKKRFDALPEGQQEDLRQQMENEMEALRQRYEEHGIYRKWKLADMVFDVDFDAVTVKGITPTDWERTKVDWEKANSPLE